MTRRKNPVCDPEQITKNIEKMRVVLDRLAPYGAHVRDLKAFGQLTTASERETVRDRIATAGYRDLVLAEAPVLFRGILQQYQLPHGLRQRIELASRFYSKRMTPAIRTFQSLQQLYKAYQTHYEAAQEAVRVGTPHDHCAVSTLREMKAGPFRIINTGGFDRATMETIQRVVEDAARRLQAKGLGAVLYGDISISNTVSRANVLAFYASEHDDMFVRANVKGLESQALHSVMHELAHRYDHKFLKDDQALRRLCWAIHEEEVEADAERRKALRGSSNYPKPGDRVFVDRRHFEVLGVKTQGKGRVQLRDVENPARYASMPLAGYLHAKGAGHELKTGTIKGFVTPYAQKDFRENFAEMIAFYAMDRLPPQQVKLLENLLKTGPMPVIGRPAVAPKALAFGELPPAPTRQALGPPPVLAPPVPSPRRASPKKATHTTAPREAVIELSPEQFAVKLLDALSWDLAQDFALSQADRLRTPYWIEVLAAILKRRPAGARSRS